MSKGGVDLCVQAELSRLWRHNPSFSFQQVAEKLYREISNEQLSRVLLYPGGKGVFQRLGEVFVPGTPIEADSILHAVIIDIFRIYAMEDEDLKARILAEAALANLASAR